MDVTHHCTLAADAAADTVAIEKATGVRFDEARASAFAKGVAGDFNPIHDPGSKRFCVPGDLLFSVMLARYGAFEGTGVRFAGMLDAEVTLALPAMAGGAVHVVDPRGREILSFFGEGRKFDDASFVARLALEYVRFSGRTFPEILVPLMRDADVMINPDRPLVIYKDMGLRIARESVGELRLAPAGSELSVTGKKGVARLAFTVEDDAGASDGPVAEGEKNLVLSGLRAWDAAAMDGVVSAYEARRGEFADADGGDPHGRALTR